MRNIINIKTKTLGLLSTFAFLGLAPTTWSEISPTDVDPPVIENIEANTEIKVIAPSNTFYGTRGLSQTASAEALGEGRLIFGLQGGWYRQQKSFPLGPNEGANIFTGIGSVSLGLSRHVDAFGSFTGFGSTDYDTDRGSGVGSMGAGVQGTLPFDQAAPIRMAAQFGIYQGLSDNAIVENGADGYNYFETRSGLDFMGKLVQTLVFGNENQAFKLHFNEGLVTSAESGTDALLLLAAGAQFNLFNTVLGLEANARTPINEISVVTDPFWITPSVQFRTRYDLNVTLGGDIALSQGRGNTPARALEPYRLFAAMAFTFDTQAGKRQRAKEKARREFSEKNKLQSDNQELAADLIKQAKEDSLAQALQKGKSDSAAADMAGRNSLDSLKMSDKARQDSLLMADRARQDSLALQDSRRRLAEEKSKLSEAEKQLLSTGLLLMDAVYFETNKTDISINSKPYLNIIAKMLTKYRKLNVEVAGHTDNAGSDGHNLALSQGRSESVVTYMISVAPDLRGMLTAKGYGEAQPKADNSTADGRKHNRRTELAVLNKEVLKEYNP